MERFLLSNFEYEDDDEMVLSDELLLGLSCFRLRCFLLDSIFKSSSVSSLSEVTSLEGVFHACNVPLVFLHHLNCGVPLS